MSTFRRPIESSKQSQNDAINVAMKMTSYLKDVDSGRLVESDQFLEAVRAVFDFRPESSSELLHEGAEVYRRTGTVAIVSDSYLSQCVSCSLIDSDDSADGNDQEGKHGQHPTEADAPSGIDVLAIVVGGLLVVDYAEDPDGQDEAGGRHPPAELNVILANFKENFVN